jgi:hypothetical protein
MALRPPGQPDRSQFSGEDLEAYDQVIERERNRGGVDENGKINAYYGSLLQSPQMCFHIASMGRLVRQAGDRDDTYSHADREWVDQVLCWDWRTNVVMRGHLEDALVRGVRAEAIKALREGREQDLTDDEQLLTEYIRQVRDGRVSDETYGAIEQRMSKRGAVEYTIFIMFLNLTMRLIEAMTGDYGPSDEELMKEIDEYVDGTRAIPTEALIGSG